MATAVNMTPDTLITIKVVLGDAQKRLKLPLKDLNAYVLPGKLRTCLNITAEQDVIFERYSDSAGGFITIDAANVPAYKALVRAAKAKGKLRIRATINESQQQEPVRSTIIPSYVPAPPPYPAVPDFSAKLRHAELPTWSQSLPPITLPSISNLEPVSVTDEAVLPPITFPSIPTLEPTPVAHEAPLPDPFVDNSAPAPVTAPLAFRIRDVAQETTNQAAWSVYCNSCDAAMANEHYHCSICDNGDYDLCETCVATGKLCPGEDHWLIKRFIQDGKVVSSVTERVGGKFQTKSTEKPVMPGAFNAEDTKVLAEETSSGPARTCNNCVIVLPEREFVNCNDCSDFDLCLPCHTANTHGHHPAHEFSPATFDRSLSVQQQNLLKSGRNVMHNAYCDGCDKKIFGVRHKCLNCPDWDYCSNCVEKSGSNHPGHRFAAIYEQLIEPPRVTARHFGVYCDGPLCSGKQNYIQGVRYKCAVCHDTDFCAACEALPRSKHNPTHPLIKFRTPVRNVNVQTINSNDNGRARTLGDKPVITPEPVKTENVEVPVKTVAEIAPYEEKPIFTAVQPKDGDVSSPPRVIPATELNAIFVRDSIRDGTVMAPGTTFVQTWTLRNEGPYIWPAGCSVRYVGGDNMFNVSNGQPGSLKSLGDASESSVVAREVKVGEEVSFKVTLKAPLREGKSISYWRLKAADGTPFGHRLWCDIDVSSNTFTTTDAPWEGFRPSHHSMRAGRARFPASGPVRRSFDRTRGDCSRPVPRLGSMPVGKSCNIGGPSPPWSNPPFSNPVIAKDEKSTDEKSAERDITVNNLKDFELNRQAQARARVDQIKEKISQYRADQDKARATQLQQQQSLLDQNRAQVLEQNRAQALQRQQAAIEQNKTRAMQYKQFLSEQNKTRAMLQQQQQSLMNDLYGSNQASSSSAEQQPIPFMPSQPFSAMNAHWRNIPIAGASTSASNAVQESPVIAVSPSTSKDMQLPPYPTVAQAPPKALADYDVELKLLEKRNKERLEMARAEQKQEPFWTDKSPVVAEGAETETAESDVAKEPTETALESASSSQMVFPKLDKESPANSIISSTKGKAATVETEDGEVEGTAAPAEDVDEEFDELEVLSISDSELEDADEDDGFLTDEEYDILDASDRETVVSP